MLRLLPRIELIYEDESGNTSALTLTLRADTTVEDADAATSAILPIANAMTGCSLVRTRLIYKSRPNIPDMAASGSSVTHSGIILIDASGDTPGAILTIPGILSSLLLTEGPFAGIAIDRGNTDFVSFINTVIAAGATNPFGDAVTAVSAAYLISRF